MGAQQSKRSVNYYEHVIHETADELRRDPNSMQQKVSEGHGRLVLASFSDICDNQWEERTGVWANPRAEWARLDDDCSALRKAFSRSKRLQDAHLAYDLAQARLSLDSLA